MPRRLDLRRMAAIDMWGSAGTRRRRWVVLAEFLVGVLGIGALGLTFLSTASAGHLVTALWLIGVAANYVPLSVHAVRLIRPGVLEAEVADVDVPAELRHYTVMQLWVLVPLAFVVLAAARWRREG